MVWEVRRAQITRQLFHSLAQLRNLRLKAGQGRYTATIASSSVI